MDNEKGALAPFTVDQYQAKSHLRRQSALMNAFYIQPLGRMMTTDERCEATRLVETLFSWHEQLQPAHYTRPDAHAGSSFRPGVLLREVLDQALGVEGRDNIMRYILTCVVTHFTDQKVDDVDYRDVRSFFASGLDNWPEWNRYQAVERLIEVANHLCDHFLAPCKQLLHRSPFFPARLLALPHSLCRWLHPSIRTWFWLTIGI
jgi:hypothetical protein